MLQGLDKAQGGQHDGSYLPHVQVWIFESDADDLQGFREMVGSIPDPQRIAVPRVRNEEYKGVQL